MLTKTETERNTPDHCPYCGGTDTVYIGDWSARSLEDPSNVCELAEYQCRDCDNRSYFA